MATIDDPTFIGDTPYELHFTYNIDADHAGELTVMVPAPNQPDTAVLQSLIAALSTDPAWDFTVGFIAHTATQQINP